MTESGTTALYIAASRNRLPLVKLLLGAKANANIRSLKGGWTALAIACHHGFGDVARELVAAGADLEADELSANRTPLFLASSAGFVDLARSLLAAGASTAHRDSNNRTCFHRAVMAKHLECTRLLYETGAFNADEAAASDGFRPLHSSCQNGDDGLALTRYLIEAAKCDIEARTTLGSTPFLLACRSGGLETAQFLLSVGADKEATYPHFSSALHVAAELGRAKVVEWLLSPAVGLNMEAATDMRNTPLLLAAREGHVDVVRVLLRRGCNAGAVNNSGSTALHMACLSPNKESGGFECARALVYETRPGQIDVDARNKLGLTPFLDACNTCAAPETIRFLIDEAKCAVGAATLRGNNALHLACMGCDDAHIRVVALLLERCVASSSSSPAVSSPTKSSDNGGAAAAPSYARIDINACGENNRTALSLACQYAKGDGGDGVVELLLAADGIDVNIASSLGNTALHFCATTLGAATAAKLVLAHHGCTSRDAVDKLGATPLMTAAAAGNLDALKVLISAGCNKNLKSTGGTQGTALHAAAFAGHAECVKFLLSCGCDVDAQSVANGLTPLAMACSVKNFTTGHADSIRALLARRADKNARSKAKSTPASFAAIHSLDALKLLAEINADLCSANDAGWTPLMEAAAAGNLDTVSFLCEATDAASTKECVATNGVSALILAITKGHGAVVRYLLSAAKCHPNSSGLVSGLTPLLVACGAGNLDSVKLLLENGADRTAVTVDVHHNALTEAVSKGQLAVAEFLLSPAVAGGPFDVNNSKDASGSAPLHHAARACNIAMAKLLGAHGADKQAADSAGLTPLHCAHGAKARGVAGADAMVAHLVGIGCSADAKSAQGKTPEEYAASLNAKAPAAAAPSPKAPAAGAPSPKAATTTAANAKAVAAPRPASAPVPKK